MTLRHKALLAACALPALAVSAHADVNVVASIKPVHSLVAAVMQGAGTPTLIVEGAASPHTYSLKPSQAAALQDADLIFWVGDGLENFLEKPIETIGADTKSVELMHSHDLVTLGFREGGAFEKHAHADEDHDDDHDGADDHEHEDEHAEDHDHEDGHDHDDDHEDHDHGSVDMHLWLDPVNAKAMTHEIAEALAAADPDNASLYEGNAAAVIDRIDALTAELSADLEPLRGKGYIVFHDAYQYFENRFGLTPAGSITVTPDIMPGAERLTEIRAKVTDLGATCVFSEPQFEPKLISVITEGTDAKSGTLDPLGAELEDGPELYFDLLRGLATSFKTCLSAE